jgi:hypothetical protein
MREDAQEAKDADEGCADSGKCSPLRSEYAKLGMMIHNLWKEWRKLA